MKADFIHHSNRLPVFQTPQAGQIEIERIQPFYHDEVMTEQRCEFDRELTEEAKYSHKITLPDHSQFDLQTHSEF